MKQWFVGIIHRSTGYLEEHHIRKAASLELGRRCLLCPVTVGYFYYLGESLMNLVS